MTSKSKTPSKLDKIDDIETQVDSSSDTDGSETEEKVINVRIPRKKVESKDEEMGKTTNEVTTKKDEPSEKASLTETSDKLTMETKEETPEIEKNPESSKTVVNEPSVSSFSLLDAEKVHSTETKGNTASQPVETQEEASSEVNANKSATKDKDTESTDNLSEWLDDSSAEKMTDSPATIDRPKGSKLKAFFIALLIVITLGVIGGGIYYYTTQVDVDEPSPVDVTTNNLPTPTSTPTPTEAPEPVDLSEYSVEVLNGSGVAGQAGLVGSLLEREGFASAYAANADNQSYEVTIVTMKEDTPAGVFDELVTILGDQYVLELSDESLDEDSEYDVQVILGSLEPEEDDNLPEDTEETSPTPTEEVGI